MYLHVLSSLPFTCFTLPFKNNTLKSYSCLTGEKAILKAKNGKLYVAVFNKKPHAYDTILEIRLGNTPNMEN